MTDPRSLRAVAAMEALDGPRGVVRHAAVAYAVSPAIANAAEALAAGLRTQIDAWKALALRSV